MPLPESGIQRALDRILGRVTPETLPLANKTPLPAPVPEGTMPQVAPFQVIGEVPQVGTTAVGTAPVSGSVVQFGQTETPIKRSIGEILGLDITPKLDMATSVIAPSSMAVPLNIAEALGLETAPSKSTVNIPPGLPQQEQPVTAAPEEKKPGLLTRILNTIYRYTDLPWAGSIAVAMASAEKRKEPGDLEFLRKVNELDKKYGWRMLFTTEFEEAYHNWKTVPLLKGMTELLNPIYFIPIAGWGGRIVGAATKLPLIGRAASSMIRAAEIVGKVPILGRFVAGEFVGGAAKQATKRLAGVITTKIPSNAVLMKELYPDNLMRRVAQYLPKPLVKIVGGEAARVRNIPFTPAMLRQIERHPELAEELAVKGVGVWHHIRAIGNASTNVGRNILDSMGDPARLFGIDEGTKIASRVGLRTRVPAYIARVFERPGDYILTTPQKNYIKVLKGLTDDLAVIARNEGIPFSEREFQEGMWYIHRVVERKSTLVRALPNVGAQRAFQKTRLYEDILEGIKAGVPYSSNPSDYYAFFSNQVYRGIADKRLTAVINPLTRTLERGAAIPLGWSRPSFRRFAALGNKMMPEAAWAKIESGIRDQTVTWLRATDNINAALRTIKASLDFSAPFLQGLPVLGRRPDVWARSTAKMFEFFLDPRLAKRYYSTNSRVIMEGISNGLTVGYTEYMEALPRILRLTSKIPIAGAIPREIFYRFGTAFTAFGDVARIEMWRALSPMAKKQGTTMELARLLNRMTGVMSSSALGIPATQRALESLGLFAPQYTRAGLALMGDVFRGGYTGGQARRALGQLMAGGAAFYTGLCYALGQKPNFDPRSGRFMTIEVEGRHYGVGGITYGLARMIGNVMRVAEEDPVSLFKIWKFDHPSNQFWYSRSSPIMGRLVEALRHKTFLGEELETPGAYAKWIRDAFTPIALSSALTEDTGAVGLFGEEMGLRTFPTSSYEVFNDRVVELANTEAVPNLTEEQQKKLTSEALQWGDLDAYQQTTLLGNNSELQALYDKSLADRMMRQSDNFKNWAKELQYIRDTRSVGLQQAEAFLKEVGDGKAFRAMIGDIYQITGALQEDLGNRNIELYEWFDKNNVNATQFDLAYEDYLKNIIGAPDLEDQYGNFLYDVYNQRLDAWRQKWGEQFYDMAQTVLASRRQEPPVVALLRWARTEVLVGYWNIPEENTQGRIQWRVANPEGDALLFVFGYTNSVRTYTATNFIDVFKQQYGLTNLPSPNLSSGAKKLRTFLQGGIVE